MSTRARDFFEEESDFEELLEKADSGARSAGDREFVENMIEYQEMYGLNTFISEAQLEWLQRLADK